MTIFRFASVSKNHGGQSTEGETSVVGGPKVCVSSDESSLSSSSIHGSKADSEAGKGSPPQLSGPLPVRSTSVQLTPNVVHASSTDEGPSNAGSLNGEKAQSIEIDGKIDKAMDLVKVHLLYAVRTEVKQLKEEIDRLNKELSCLKIENCILRRHVPLEVIAVLSRMRWSTGSLFCSFSMSGDVTPGCFGGKEFLRSGSASSPSYISDGSHEEPTDWLSRRARKEKGYAHLQRLSSEEQLVQIR
ncbi:TSC-22/dip/bun family protein [Trichuris suis]|nr:TSC-22/dip/bun family protein [Trichuris suis]